MKQFRGTLIMAVVVGALAAYAYFGEFKKRQAEETAKDEQSVVVKIEKSKVTGVKLIKDGSVLEISKEGESWSVKAPIVDSGDDDAIKGWLENLTTEKSETEIKEQIEWALFGLDHPIYTVEVSGGGKAEKVSVGKDALGGKIYLRHNEDNAVLVANAIWKGFGDKTAKDLRNKALWRNEGKSAVALTIESEKGKVALSKKDGKWMIGGAEEAGAEEIQSYITQIESLKANDVVGENRDDKKMLQAHDLAKPRVKVTLGFADASTPWILQVSKPTKLQEAYAFTSDLKPIYKIFGTTSDSLAKSANDFRDKKKPFDFLKADVKQIDIKSGLANITLEQKDGKWQMADVEKAKPANSNKEVDQDQVESLLSQLGSLRAKDFLKEQKADSKKTMSLKDQAGKVVMELAWAEGAKDKNEYKVKTNLYKEAVTVDKATIDAIPIQTLLKEKPQASPQPEKTQSTAPETNKDKS